MSLLSLKRVSIFNESIVSFINLLATDPKWNSSRFAEYGSYLIDQMSLEIKPGKDLIQLFSSFVQTPEHKQQFSVILTESELLRQRKVFVTPTLIKYSTASEEESNRVIRKFKGQISNFIRLCFVNENMDKGYYFNQEETNNNFILGYIFRIVSEGFWLSNLQFKFLAYSNSQLKAHSAWFLCANNPHEPIKES